jgi:hypothetical protein
MASACRALTRRNRAAVVGERLGRRCPNRAAGKGWSNIGSAWLARVSTPDLGRRFACVQAAAPRSPPGRPRELSQRQVPVGGGGAGKEQVLPSPPHVHPGQVVGVMADHGLDGEVVTTLRGR